MAQSDPETMTTYTYELRCTDCGFETTVEGDTDAALDVAESHQEEYGDDGTDHFVNCEVAEPGSGNEASTDRVRDDSATRARK